MRRTQQQVALAVEVVFDGAGNGGFFGVGHLGVAEGNDNALAGLALGVAIAFNELQKRGALDCFGAEKHRGQLSRKGGRKSRAI